MVPTSTPRRSNQGTLTSFIKTKINEFQCTEKKTHNLILMASLCLMSRC